MHVIIQQPEHRNFWKGTMRGSSSVRPVIALWSLGVAAYIVVMLWFADSTVVGMVNTALPFFLALSTAVPALLALPRIPKFPRDFALGLGVGLLLWVLAEGTWFAYALRGQEPPDVSIADVFWLAGYGPLIWVFYRRAQALPPASRRERALVWSLGLIYVLIYLWGFIAVEPLSFEEGLWFPLTQILYAAGDFILLLYGIRFALAWSLQFGRAWVWLASGFGLISFSDWAFFILGLQEAYALFTGDWVSRWFVDVPYTLGYAVILLALVVMVLEAQRYPHELGIGDPPPPPANAHFLAAVLPNGWVLRSTATWEEAFPSHRFQPLNLPRQLLGMDEQAFQALMEQAKLAPVPEWEQEITTHRGPRWARISAAMLSAEVPQLTFLIRFYEPDAIVDERLLQTDVAWWHAYLYVHRDIYFREDAERREAILYVYGLQLAALYRAVWEAHGAQGADAFFHYLNHRARQYHMYLRLSPSFPRLIDAGALSAKDLLPILRRLWEDAQTFGRRVLGTWPEEPLDPVWWEVLDYIERFPLT